MKLDKKCSKIETLCKMRHQEFYSKILDHFLENTAYTRAFREFAKRK